jgi:hypothetical protein
VDRVAKAGSNRCGPRVSADLGGATLTTTTTAVVSFNPAFADPRRLALGEFLAGYSGLTREAYELDLGQFVVCGDNHELGLSPHPLTIARKLLSNVVAGPAPKKFRGGGYRW